MDFIIAMVITLGCIAMVLLGVAVVAGILWALLVLSEVLFWIVIGLVGLAMASIPVYCDMRD